MSHEGLQAVIGMAIIDKEFRDALLSGPAAAVEGFALSSEEREIVGAIRAKSLEQFSARLEQLRSKRPIKGDAQRAVASWTTDLARSAG